MRLVIVLLLLSCCTLDVVPIVVDPGDADLCPVACSRLRALGCPEGAPLADGTSCEKFCVDTTHNGMPLNPKCISEIQSCSEIAGCSEAR